LPPGAKAVTLWRKQEEAFFVIATELKKVVEKLHSGEKNKPSDKSVIDITLFEQGVSDPSKNIYLYEPSLLDRRGDPVEVGADNTPLTKIEVVNHFYGNHHSVYTLHYSYHRAEETIVIKPNLPYLTHLLHGDLIYGYDYADNHHLSPFSWCFPRLSIKVLNNSNKALFLSEAIIQVKASEIRTEPVPVISSLSLPGWEFQ